MPNTGFFRASSIELIGGTNPTGTDNLILNGEGQFSADIVAGDPTSDPLEVTLNFTDFFIPEGNRVTGIEYILEGQVNTGNFVNITAPEISAGTPDAAGQLLTPTPSNVLGVQAGSLTLTYSPANHTYTMDVLYQALEQGAPVEGPINSINSIIGNTPNRVVKLAIPLDALAGGVNTLTLVGATGASPLPAIRIFYEKTTFTKVKAQTQTKVKLQPVPTVESVIKGPNSHDVLGNVGDGLTYGAVEEDQRERLMETSIGPNGCTFTNSFPNGFKIFNFFNNNQIPLNTTITGVELIAGQDFDGGTSITDNSRIATFGTSTGQIRIECRFYNGVNYSDILSWDADGGPYGGIEFLDIEGGTNNRASFSGANRFYKNLTAGDDVLFGGPNDLSGLNWDPANQANFGFGFITTDGSGNSTAGVTRGIRMKVYYQTNTFTKVTIF